MENAIKRKLSARYMSMIAIGGCIGSGLFMASGQAIATAGPGGALLAYILIGIMVYFLMTSLGEMATYFPVSGSFSTYASRYVDPSLGFALGWNYWLSWVITVVADVGISAMIIHYWDPMQFLPIWGWALIFLGCIVALNMLSVKLYGESEYWFSLFKVVTIIVFLGVGVLTIFGILGGEFIGFKNITSSGVLFLGNSIWEQIFACLGVFLIAGYSFQGTELLGITAGETKDPDKNIPKAMKQIFWRIVIFYIFSILIIGILIPYNSPELLGGDPNEIAKSPFTIVFQNAGFAFAASVMNAMILTSLLSASNSGLYASTRMLYAMSVEKVAYAVFSKTTSSGVPIFALGFTIVIICLVLLIQAFYGNAYEYLVASVGLIGFIAGLGIAVSHYRFRRAFLKQGRSLSELKYVARWFPFGPIIALIFGVIVIVGQNTDLIFKGIIDWKAIFMTYMGLPIFLGFYIFHKIKYKTQVIPLEKVQLDSKE